VLNNLQVLRALAACLVVLTHTVSLNKPLLRPWLTWGEAGVDLFFVISGFVMVYTTADKSVTPHKFALNRIVRIVPMYWGLTLAVFAVALIAPSLLQASRADWGELLKSLFFIPFVKSNGLTQPVLFLGWTLNYEMFFYALFALSLMIRSVGLRTGLMVVVLALLVAAGLLIEPASPIARFYTDPILLEFLFGMLLGYAHWRTRSSAIPLRWAHVAFGLAAVLVVPQIFIATDGHRALTWGVPAALIVLGALLLDLHGRSHQGRFLLLVGAASYVLYLTHPFIAIPVEKLAVRLGLVELPVVLVSIVLEVSLATLVAIAVHLAIERPVTAVLRGWLAGDRGRPQWRDAFALWPWRLKS
jgi:exopolysaccharide production protein ExoZ